MEQQKKLLAYFKLAAFLLMNPFLACSEIIFDVIALQCLHNGLDFNRFADIRIHACLQAVFHVSSYGICSYRNNEWTTLGVQSIFNHFCRFESIKSWHMHIHEDNII